MNRIVLYSAAAFFTVFGTTCQTEDTTQEKYLAGLKKPRKVSSEGAIASIKCETIIMPTIETIDSNYVYNGSGIACPIIDKSSEK